MGLDLAGATVLLTGASAGIGAAAAPVLAERGATVVVTGRRRERLDALVATLPGDGHIAVAADLAAPGAPEDVVAAAESAYCASKVALAGWAEAVAIDLWDSPVEVRLILPGPIDTEIWDRPGSDGAHYDGPLEPPSTVATAIAYAIEGDAFEVYSPDLRGVVEWKTSNAGADLSGVAGMARSATR